MCARARRVAHLDRSGGVEGVRPDAFLRHLFVRARRKLRGAASVACVERCAHARRRERRGDVRAAQHSRAARAEGVERNELSSVHRLEAVALLRRTKNERNKRIKFMSKQ
jgi:hypothetical protein